MAAYDIITTKDLEGTGLFDVLMQTSQLHLKREFQSGHIKNTDYSTVYLGSLEAVLGNTIQYLLGNALLEEKRAQINAEIEKIQAEKALIELQATLVPAELAKLASETNLIDKQIEKIDYEITYLLPLEKAKLELMNTKITQEGLLIAAQIPKIEAEAALLDTQNDIAEYELANKLPEEVNKILAEISLLEQKYKSEIAQILDQVDGVDVAGVIGRQNDLVEAQKEGFFRKAEKEMAQIMAGVYQVQRTTDEELPTPKGLSNDDIYTVMKVAVEGIGATIDQDTDHPIEP